MRDQRVFRCAVAIAIALCAFKSDVTAQNSGLRVLRYTPVDSGSAEVTITATFDRPVAGMLDGGVEARRVMTLTPAVKGTFEWRDPITIRFIPHEAFVPGTSVTVSLDTAMIASAGARSGTPYQFSVRFPGARPQGNYVNGRPATDEVRIGPLPIFRTMYSAPVDLDSAARNSRLVFSAECGGTIGFKPVREYPVQTPATVDPENRRAPDVSGNQFLRWVELIPADSLRPDCTGVWHVAAFDGKHPKDTWQYSLKTAPAFAVTSVKPCLTSQYYNTGSVCEPDGISVTFAANVTKDELRKHVHISPQLPLAKAEDGVSASLFVPARLVPTAKYTVSVDSSLRDLFGRKFTGPQTFTVTANHRTPGVLQQSGLMTMSSDMQVPVAVTVRTLNVDTLAMYVIPIPDSLDANLFWTPWDRGKGAMSVIRGALRDTIKVIVPVHGKLDEETTVSIPIPDNVRHRAGFSLSEIRFVIQSRSIPELQPEKPAPDNGKVGLVVQFSSLRAQTKISNNQGAIFVTDAFGNVVGNALVRLIGASGATHSTGTTGTNGLGMLVRKNPEPKESEGPLKSYDRAGMRYVLVTRGNERLILLHQSALKPASGMSSIDSYGLGAARFPAELLQGTITTDRDIYRRGETMYVKAYVRHGIPGAIESCAGDSIRIVLDPYDTITTRKLVLSEFGTATTSFKIPAEFLDDRLRVSADVKIDGTWQELEDIEVKVAEFRAPEFVLSANTDSVRHHVGDTLSLKLDGKYLFGGPMNGGAINWNASSRANDELLRSIPGTSGFTIGQRSWWDSAPKGDSFFMSEPDSLDGNGRAIIRIATDKVKVTGPVAIDVRVTVSDFGNQTVSLERTLFLDAASFHVAARTLGAGWQWKAGVTQAVEAFVVRANGSRVAGVPLDVKIVRHHLVADTADGKPIAAMHWVADTVKRLQLQSNDSATRIEFMPEFEGAYDIAIAARDEHQRVAMTDVGRWALNSPRGLVAGDNPLRLRMTTQRDSTGTFAVGDTAHVTFESPFENAYAWITIEREFILEQRQLLVRRGETIIDVPVTNKMAPNIYVGVTLVDKRSSASVMRDSLNKMLKVGYAEIRLDSTAHLLRVRILPPSRAVAPGDSARIRVVVNDMSSSANKGVRSEVALWAVDEGVLSLTDYKTPDILAALDAKAGVSASLHTSLAALPWKDPQGLFNPFTYDQPFGGIFNLSTESVGKTLDIDSRLAELSRSEFRFTAFFVGHAITDANGVASIHAKLPDNITTFRLMATAIGTGARYGSSEAPLLVSRRVVLRPALPRFVRNGDSLTAATLLNVRDSVPASLRIRASIADASLLGDSVRTVTTSNGATVRANFTMTVPERTARNQTRVSFSAVDLGTRKIPDGDAITLSLPIRAPGSPRAHVKIGMMRDTGSVAFELPADIDPDRSTVAFSMGSSPLVAMRTQFERLRAYPYYCTELVVTSARALLALSRAEKTIGERLVTGDSARVRGELQLAVDELVRRERGNGYFVFWADGTVVEDAWTSAFVGSFLLDAKREGIHVPAKTLADIKQGLESRIRNETPDTLTGTPAQRAAKYRMYLGGRVHYLRYLRDMGAPFVQTEDYLLARIDLLAWEDRIALAELISQRADLSDRAREILAQSWSAVGLAGKRIEFPDSLRGAASFPSHIRPAARLLSAAMRLTPTHPLIGALAETIIQQGTLESAWAWNNQDYGSAIEALAEFVRAQRGSVPATVVVSDSRGRVLFTTSTRTANTGKAPGTKTRNDAVRSLTGMLQTPTAGTAQLRLSVRVQSNGKTQPKRTQPLYYAFTVQETPKTRPVTPDNMGILVERWYERFDDGKPVVEAQEGDLIRVRVRVTVPSDRQYVAIEDPLPAGLEAVDLSLRTASTVGPFAKRSEREREEDADALARSMDAAGGGGFGSFDRGWWQPWSYRQIRDDRVFFFAPFLWTGTYSASYVARATASGVFVKPPAHAEEMYNPALQGRSDGGVFTVRPR